MKSTLLLTEPERLTLQQLSLNHPHRDIRTRAAGLLLLAREFKPRQICHELGCSYQSVYNWAHAWRRQGICGLLTGHAGGRPPALSPEMIATAVGVAQQESMTLAKIAQQLEFRHGAPLPCCLYTLSQALKAAGLSYKRSRYSLKKT